jgi:hypothetical protein
MTYKQPQKIRQFQVYLAQFLVAAAGLFEALLLARWVVRLFAVRPDNVAFALLLAFTEPLVAPLHFLDYDQPPFGAAFEFSTLVMATLVPLFAYVVWLLLTKDATNGDEQTS